MKGDRRRRAEELFQLAVDQPVPGRAEFIARQSGADPVLRGDVEQLLRAYETDAGGFMATPAGGAPTDPGERPGDLIGPYKLLSLLGQGAFGDVYVAEQTGPVRRNVALKIVKLGMDTRQVVARFEAERQALALMEHPHIAKVYEAGSTESGRPYFAMEHVPGVPISEYCDRHRLSIKQRLRLFLLVCDAVQHAHQKGIIHRDVKPSNVLVKMVGDQPVPKVIDFGIAKATGYSLTELTLFTDRGQLIGTPEYMSPEQAEVSASNVDTRADIYSLGVVLYELLAGTLPFEAGVLRSGTLQDIQSRIREQQPPRPSTCIKALATGSAEAARCRRTTPHTLRRRLKGELDWITMKAMEKDRSRRYATVSELAGDVKRHLRHEPVLAGPPSTFYRLRKLIRRNRAATIATLVVFVGLTWGTVGLTVGLHEAKQERDRARRAVSIALTVMLDTLQSSDAEISPQAAEDVYWALTETFGEPASGKQETVRKFGSFIVAARLLSQGQAAEAEAVLVPLQEWADRQFRQAGSVNAATVLVRELLAEAKIALEKYGEAEPVAQEAYRGYLELYGRDASRTRAARDRLVRLYEGWGRPDDAARWRDTPESSPSKVGK
ncbi:MAG: serine/threonine protein kinase [Planctomycetota bacterium]|jgi:serine/threonine protein kinase